MCSLRLGIVSWLCAYFHMRTFLHLCAFALRYVFVWFWLHLHKTQELRVLQLIDAFHTQKAPPTYTLTQ